MRAGKDYFTDKTAFTTLEQLEETKKVVKETGRKFWVYFSERLHVEGAVFAGQLIDEGCIGEVIQVTGFGPHHLDKESRPDWFFNREEYRGILTNDSVEHFEVNGKVGFPFFGEMILDCINRTENAMTQEHIFKAQELCLLAQKEAIKIR